MGKVIAIAITIVVLALICVFVIWLLLPKENKKLTKQELLQQRLLLDAAKTMSAIGVGIRIDEVDILTQTTRDNINNWLERYSKYQGEIERA